MKIVNVEINSYKGVNSLEFKPEKTNLISGPNGAGKTSIVEAILFGLGKIAAGKDTINKDSDGSIVSIKLEDEDGKIINVKRSQFVDEEGNLETKHKASYELGGDVQITKIKKLINKLGLDINYYYNMQPKDRKIRIANLIGVDMEKHIEEVNILTEKRSSEHGLALGFDKTLKETRINIPAKIDQIDISSLTQELQSVMNQNKNNDHQRLLIQSGIDVKRNEYSACTSRNEWIRNEITRLTEELNLNTIKAAEIIAEGNVLKEQLQTVPVNLSTDDIQGKIQHHQTNNDLSNEYCRYVFDLDRVANQNKKYEDLNEAVKAKRSEMIDLIAKAKFPLEGLFYDIDLGLTYNNVPVDQLSTAERIYLFAKLAKDSFEENEMKMLWIQDGSLIDAKNLDKMIADPDLSDFTLFIERVTLSDAVEINSYSAKSN